MWTAINWWNAASLEAHEALCDRLGWPRQYGEGAADHEWLTDEQYEQLRAVPLVWLDEIDAAENAARGERTWLAF